MRLLFKISVANAPPRFALILAGHYFRLMLGIKDVFADVALYLKGATEETREVQDLNTAIKVLNLQLDLKQSHEKKAVEDVIKDVEEKLFALCTKPVFVSMDIFAKRSSDLWSSACLHNCPPYTRAKCSSRSTLTSARRTVRMAETCKCRWILSTSSRCSRTSRPCTRSTGMDPTACSSQST